MSKRASSELAPCGTAAAARRHYRHGEALDDACRAASNRQYLERTGGDVYSNQARPELPSAARNGLPIVPYQYGAPRPTWALEAIKAAEAKYGQPVTDHETDFEAA